MVDLYYKCYGLLMVYKQSSVSTQNYLLSLRLRQIERDYFLSGSTDTISGYHFSEEKSELFNKDLFLKDLQKVITINGDKELIREFKLNSLL